MTTRSDLPRLGASLGLLGTVIERDGQTAWDRTFGWTFGPRKAPASGERGGGGCEASGEDRKAEEKQRQRAAEHFAEFKADLDLLDAVVQRLLRKIDIAVPPNVSEMKNRRTDDLDPVTAADVAAAGWCKSCWRNDQQLVPIETNKATSLRYFRDYCRYCGSFNGTYGMLPPMEILKLRHEGRRISQQDVQQALTEARKSERKSKRQNKKKGKAA